MADGTAVTWEVTDVTQETQFGLGGTPIPGKNIAFKTSTGYLGTVFIPDSVFMDTAALTKAIEGEVKAVAAAMAVRGTVGG